MDGCNGQKGSTELTKRSCTYQTCTGHGLGGRENLSFVTGRSTACQHMMEKGNVFDNGFGLLVLSPLLPGRGSCDKDTSLVLYGMNLDVEVASAANGGCLVRQRRHVSF